MAIKFFGRPWIQNKISHKDSKNKKGKFKIPDLCAKSYSAYPASHLLYTFCFI